MDDTFARSLLNLPSLPTRLSITLIRTAFREKVLAGHSDRGGSADIKLLCDARDVLLSLVIVKNTSCSDCCLEKTGRCRYHTSFPV